MSVLSLVLMAASRTIPPNQDYWIASLDSARVDAGNHIHGGADGYVHVSGYTTTADDDTEIQWAKYAPNGLIQSQFSAGLEGADLGFAVGTDDDGNRYILGATDSVHEKPSDFVLIKQGPTGTVIWQRALGGAEVISTSSDFRMALAVNGDGDCYICGTARGKWIAVAKYDTDGDLQWNRWFRDLINTGDSNFGNAIALDASDNVYVVGQGTPTGGDTYATLFKWNSSGVLQWQKGLTHTSPSMAGYGIAIDGSGNFYIGIVQSSGTDDWVILAKLNSSAVIQWSRRVWDNDDAGVGGQVALDTDGNAYIVGGIGSSRVIRVAKYNPSGTMQWDRSLVADGSTATGTGITIADGKVYVSGIDDSLPNGGILLASLPADGSGTGTYGDYTLANLGSTDQGAAGLTIGTTTFTESLGLLSSSSLGLTVVQSGLGSTRTGITS